jgi:hypothetical protein
VQAPLSRPRPLHEDLRKSRRPSRRPLRSGPSGRTDKDDPPEMFVRRAEGTPVDDCRYAAPGCRAIGRARTTSPVLHDPAQAPS